MARATTRPATQAATQAPTQAPPWLTGEQQRAWRAFVAMSQHVSLGVDRQLQRDAGMPHAYYAVLVALSEAPARTLPLGELATTLGYSLSRLSHALTRLQAEGWVERRPCPTSKRVTFVRLTRRGAAALRVAAPGHASYVRDVVLAGLDARQLAQLAAIAERVVASVAPEARVTRASAVAGQDTAGEPARHERLSGCDS